MHNLAIRPQPEPLLIYKGETKVKEIKNISYVYLNGKILMTLPEFNKHKKQGNIVVRKELFDRNPVRVPKSKIKALATIQSHTPKILPHLSETLILTSEKKQAEKVVKFKIAQPTREQLENIPILRKPATNLLNAPAEVVTLEPKAAPLTMVPKSPEYLASITNKQPIVNVLLNGDMIYQGTDKQVEKFLTLWLKQEAKKPSEPRENGDMSIKNKFTFDTKY